MTSRFYRPGDLHIIRDLDIERHLNDFLRIDSVMGHENSILRRPDFEPDSFTIWERLSNPHFLSPSERDGKEFLRNLIAVQLQMLQAQRLAVMEQPDSCLELMVNETIKFLEHKVKGIPIGARIFNQEFTDVLNALISYFLEGDPNYEFRTNQAFNDLGAKVGQSILERHLHDADDLKSLLGYSIASGLIGLDMKGSISAASALTNTGIPLRPILGLDTSSMADTIFMALRKVVSKGFVIDHWSTFRNEVVEGENRRLVLLTDDFIETMFDLHFVRKLLDRNSSLTVSIIPRNGQYGNDASYADLMNMLSLPLFSSLLPCFSSGKLRILSGGPRMGTVNLRKLSTAAVEELRTGSVVYIKGCRSHEMVQGGIDAVTYTSFVVAREFTETETGLDAREAPLLFFRSAPGEYAFWGFKGRETRLKRFPDGREIGICFSTLEEHELRKDADSPLTLISDLNLFTSLFGVIPSQYRDQYDREVELIVNRLCDVTRTAYDSVAELFREIRGQEVDKTRASLIDELIEMARVRVREGRLGDKTGVIFILDEGTGHGRDLSYLNQAKDVNAVGIDNSQGFMRILGGLEDSGRIPKGCYYEKDMRNLSGFDNETFDVVRHNATILHLPMLPNRIGADQAIAESFRVLRPFGLLYVSVREGKGLEYTDTGEGLGPRIYQYYTTESLKELLERNGFRILEVRARLSQRPSGPVKWIYAFAEKPKRQRATMVGNIVTSRHGVCR